MLWFEFPRDECCFCKFSYQCRVSTLEAQEACWQTNRMIKMSQAQVFSFILNNSHCLPQTPELHGQVRPPESEWARGMTRARETCWMVEMQMQKWRRKQCCLTHGRMLTMWTCCFPRDGISLCSGLPPSFWEITSLFPGNHYVLSVRDSAYIYFYPHVLLRILVQVLTLHLCPNDLQTHVDINISIRLG